MAEGTAEEVMEIGDSFGVVDGVTGGEDGEDVASTLKTMATEVLVQVTMAKVVV